MLSLKSLSLHNALNQRVFSNSISLINSFSTSKKSKSAGIIAPKHFRGKEVQIIDGCNQYLNCAVNLNKIHCKCATTAEKSLPEREIKHFNPQFTYFFKHKEPGDRIKKALLSTKTSSLTLSLKRQQAKIENSLNQAATERKNTFTMVYKKDERQFGTNEIDQHLKGVTFKDPTDEISFIEPQVITLPAGAEMIQYLNTYSYQKLSAGESYENVLGKYFAIPGTDPATLGINPQGRKKIQVKAKQDIPEVAVSICKDIEDTFSQSGSSYQAKGGGLQYVVLSQYLPYFEIIDIEK
jgi:hypothetical protein